MLEDDELLWGMKTKEYKEETKKKMERKMQGYGLRLRVEELKGIE